MRRVRVSVVGRDGRGRECTLTPAGIFCPKCGSEAVWRRCAAADHAVPQMHLCVKCAASFCFAGFNPLGLHAALDRESQWLRDAITSAMVEAKVVGATAPARRT